MTRRQEARVNVAADVRVDSRVDARVDVHNDRLTPKNTPDLPLRIAMVAGEPSGDLLGGILIAALRKHDPRLVIEGVGGEHMRAAGMHILFDSKPLAVRGYVEALRHLPKILRIRRQLVRHWKTTPPTLFIGIDAPDFNLGLARQLKQQGITTVHFISPSIWAWRAERIDAIRQAIDRMLVVFPFEEKIYQAADIPVDYVGYPLAQIIPEVPDREAARAELGLAASTPVVVLMPGSRQTELHYLAPLFIQTAARIHKLHPDWQWLAPVIDIEAQEILQALAVSQGLPLRCVIKQSHLALAACDSALIASGTATLEAALFKRPMVIAYRMAALSWQLMKRQRRSAWIGLPNILCQESLVPEFLQSEATPQALGDALILTVTDTARASYLVDRFTALHQDLKRDTARLASERILSMARHG